MKLLGCIGAVSIAIGLLECSSEAPFTSSSYSLINSEYIKNYMTHEAAWANSHNAKGEYLGCGMLYYALAYMREAKLCVCLGSGGGFVPRVMRQAQRDLNLDNARTILVDANIGGFGRPEWLSSDHFFREEFPDIEIIMDLTANVARDNPDWKIDYLHIDADHSFDGAFQDFYDYFALMNKNGIITFHDTNEKLPCSKVIQYLKEMDYEIVNFKEFGAGFAIIYLP